VKEPRWERDGHRFDVAEVIDALTALDEFSWMAADTARTIVSEYPDCAVDVITELVARLMDEERKNERLRRKLNGKPDTPPPRRPSGLPQKTERNAEIAQLVASGSFTLDELAAKFDISRERVRQIAKAQGVIAGEVRSTLLRARHEAEAAEAEAKRMVPCRVCGTVFRSWNGRTACSDACTIVLRIGRRYLDQEYLRRQRVTQAQYVLRNPEKHRPAELTHAQEVILANGVGPTRRFVCPDSKVVEAFRKAGVEHLLPNGGQRQTPKVLTFRCASINLDGSPCARKVPAEGGHCHIHRAMTAGVTLAELVAQEDAS